MKKINLKLLTAILSVTLIAIVSIFYACKKEEDNSSISNTADEQSQILKSSDDSSSNPYDINYEYFDAVFQDVADFLSEIENNPIYDDFDKFMNDFEKLMEEHLRNNPYPKFDPNRYSSSQQQIISNIIDDYMHNIEIIGITEATEQTENTISLMSDDDLQQSMYSIVSQIKFTAFMMEDIGNILRGKVKDWEEKMADCMNAKWDSGNWIDHLEFLIELPTSAIIRTASCAWEVSHTP